MICNSKKKESKLQTIFNEEDNEINSNNDNNEADNNVKIDNNNLILDTEIMGNDDDDAYYQDTEIMNDDDQFTENDNNEGDNINKKDYRYVELFQNDPIEEIPILDDLEIDNKIDIITGIDNKEKKLELLIHQAYDIIPKEHFDELMQTYEECQNNLSDSLTKKLDYRILEFCDYDQEKYGEFLEIFYKIIYLKFLQQVDEEN